MHIREVTVKYRRSAVSIPDAKRFANSREIFDAFKDHFLHPVEVFLAIYLDSKNRLLCFEIISRGSLSTSVVHPRDCLWGAVYHRAAAMIVLHNHPSGDPSPSREDRECTLRLFNAGKILGIRLLDHVIVGEKEWFSFADAGLLNPTP